MIPKTIHYCWFGGKELPPLAKKCIKSWKKYCKGYQIIKWDERNFDITSAPLYVRQAYEAKKWAFVSDYVRLWAMTNYGGIYMDTDVEIIKPLDVLLKHHAFSGFEDEIHIQTAIMASERDFPLFNILLSYYDNTSFIKNGEIDTTNNVAIITNLCKKKGLLQNNTFQIIDGFALYPNDYFCPKSYYDGIIRKTNNTFSIHHFDSSWLSEEIRKEKDERWEKEKVKYHKKKKKARRAKAKKIFISVFGEKMYEKLRREK